MISMIKEWTLQIAGTAIISAAILAVTPDGRVKKVVSFVCGIATVIALLSIKSDFDYKIYSKKISEYKLAVSEYSKELEAVNKNLTRSIIEEKSAAYILDKGKTLGIEHIEAAVTAKWEPDGEYWYPVSAKIKVSAAEKEIKDLSFYIEASLGISEQEQIWSTYNEN